MKDMTDIHDSKEHPSFPSNTAPLDNIDLPNAIEMLKEEIAERRQAEERLRKSEELYRTVVEDQSEIICRFRPDGAYTFINDIFCRFFDKRRDELIGNKWFPEAHPEDVEMIHAKLEEMSPESPVVTIENRVYSGSGDLRWIKFINRGFYDNKNNLIEIQSVGRDITERKISEEKLNILNSELDQRIKERTAELEKANKQLLEEIKERKQSEETLREREMELKEAQRIAHLGNWNWIAATDTITWSEELYRIFGLDPLQPPPNYDGLSRLYTPETWTLHNLVVSRAMTGGEPYEEEFEFIRPDGTHGYLNAKGEAIRDSSGKIVQLRGTALEITERKLSEKALRESEEKFSRIFHTAPLMITLSSVEDGRYYDVNDGFVSASGFSREECIGKTSTELGWLSPANRQMLKEAVQKDGRIDGLELNLTTKDKRPLICLYSGEVITIGGKKMLLSTAKDITERKKAEKERADYLLFLESLEKIDRILRTMTDLDTMMQSVLDEMLSIFSSDRAWLLYPCDPEAPSWGVPMERTVQDYPGMFKAKMELPMKEEEADVFRKALETGLPLVFDPSTGYSPPGPTKELFQIQSQILIAIHAKVGKPWLLGMHQCSHPRVWNEHDRKLFTEISRRITDSLNSLLLFREVKKSEEELRKFKFISERSSDAHFLVDRDAKFRYVNRAAYSMLGYTGDELLTLAVPDVDTVYDFGKYRELFYLIQKKTVSPIETVSRRKDGSLFPAEITVTGYVIDDVPYMFAVLRDVTERKKSEEALYESEIKFRTAIESYTDGYWLVDGEARILEINEAYSRQSGYTREELLGMRISQLEVIETAEDTRAHINKVMSEGSDIFETMHRKKDGTLWNVEVNAVYSPAIEGRLFCTFRDITERKKTEEALMNALKEKETLVQEVHHRVKNNLFVLQSLISLQQSSLTGRETVDEILNTTKLRISAISKVHQMLYQSEKLSEINISQYIDSVTNDITTAFDAEKRNIGISLDLEPGMLGIEKAIPCGIIINELLTNTFKYAFTGRDSGNISISFRQKDDAFELEIRDDGVGMPEEFISEETRSLGLQLVTMLTRQLRGRLEYKRDNGSIFKIIF